MSLATKLGGKVVQKFIPKQIVVGYQIFAKANELAQDYRISQDKLTGPMVNELDALMHFEDSATEGEDYLYFTCHGLKGMGFALQKTGNAMSFKVSAAKKGGPGSSLVGRTYYLVTMRPLVIRPEAGIEVLAHARMGKNNDQFFTSIANDLSDTDTRLKLMQHPSPGVRMQPSL